MSTAQINDNSTLPATISSIRVIGAPNVRRAFLDRIIQPALKRDDDQPYNLAEALERLNKITAKLAKLGIRCTTRCLSSVWLATYT